MFFVLFSPRTFILDGVVPGIRGDQLVISTWACGDCHSRNTRDKFVLRRAPLRSSNVMLAAV